MREKVDMSIQVREFTLKTLMLFPIFTLLAFVPAATTIPSLIGMAGMIYVLIKTGIKKSMFFIVVFVSLLTVWNYSITPEKVINSNEIIYYIYLCIFTAFLVSNRAVISNYLVRDIGYIKMICRIWCIIVLVSMVLPSSYSKGVFVSFAVTTFRLSPSAIFIMSLSSVLIAEEGSQKNLIYTFVPFLSILLGSSRAYLIVGVLMLLLNLSMVVKRKGVFILSALFLLIAGLIIIINSSMGAKFISSISEHAYQDPLGVFTSGRSNFWVRDLNAFMEQPLSKRFFGCGFNFIRIVNGAVPGTDERGIWAHNDFIQILITYGVMGLLLYIVNMRIMFKKLLNSKIPFLINIAIFMIWFFNAMFNMYFTYTCSMISLPIAFMACENYRQKYSTWFGEREVTAE